jgi:hypothetical protein
MELAQTVWVLKVWALMGSEQTASVLKESVQME